MQQTHSQRNPLEELIEFLAEMEVKKYMQEKSNEQQGKQRQ